MRYGVYLFLTSVLFFSCKKQDTRGTYSGTEDLLIVSPTDTITSSFLQSVTIDYHGSKCNYQSSTLIWEFSRNEKTKTGYLQDESGKYFNLEFKGDSLIARYVSDGLETTTRTFRGKQ